MPDSSRRFVQETTFTVGHVMDSHGRCAAPSGSRTPLCFVGLGERGGPILAVPVFSNLPTDPCPCVQPRSSSLFAEPTENAPGGCDESRGRFDPVV